MSSWSLRFEGGTLVLDGVGPEALPAGFTWDPRIARARAEACAYGEFLREADGLEFEDNARAYERLEALPVLSRRTPRDYQAEAVASWRAARWRGIVVLPTGAGKSLVAELCIASVKRSALVVVPTLDLLSQWYGNLRAAFGEALVGVLGGGTHDIRPLTVATYDSVFLHAERYGDRFGLVIWDEVHHLPAPGYSRAARCLMAPARLGLTATLERPDGAHLGLDALVGPVVYRREITELAGTFLAPYRTETIAVRLSPEDMAEYQRLRGIYRSFVDRNRIRMSAPDGWQRFLMLAARSKEGRAAHAAYRESRRLEQGNATKMEVVRQLVAEEWGRRTLLFTNDNATAMRISRELLVPLITHRTDVKERRAFLDAFAAGDLPILATSRVLNEGVDLPEAEVGIVVSGTSTVREMVQRLGRILRPREGKQAVLYELVADGTSEANASDRRRDHAALR
jgi:superfamily II DNA or RNA helicase